MALALLWALGACSEQSMRLADAAAHTGQDGGGQDGSSDSGDGAAAPSCDTGTNSAVSFRKITLHRDFTCEGAGLADVNRDGVVDVIAGPEWYAGPNYATARPIWTRTTFDPKGYSDCFFQFPHDFDGDGWPDVLVVGFPGEPAAWYRNPGAAGRSAAPAAWTRFPILAAVDGESPAFADVTGDGAPELVFMNGGRLGWAGPDATDPTRPWTFHPLSGHLGFGAFTHGMGVGDLNGDQRADVVEATAYYLQPASLAGDPAWPRRQQSFGEGGAQMLIGDLNDDGAADVMSSWSAHGYGLAWFEQRPPITPSTSSAPVFAAHVIVPSTPPPADAPVVLHEPHALATADVDGDGAPDAIAGERFWGHVPAGAPDFGGPANLYWFRKTRTASGLCFTPHLIDADSGVGTQLTTGDANGDGRLDIVVANKKGAFVFLQNGPLGGK